MKKITKKGPSKAPKKRTTKNLDVKPAKGGTIRGGSLPRQWKWIE